MAKTTKWYVTWVVQWNEEYKQVTYQGDSIFTISSPSASGKLRGSDTQIFRRQVQEANNFPVLPVFTCITELDSEEN